MKRFVLLGLLLAAAAGCKTSYVWTGSVPSEMRTVAVPTFRNKSDVTELGSVMARQVSREFQREGTFRVARPSEAAIEIQGVIESASAGSGYGDRRAGYRYAGYQMRATVTVSVIDHRSGKVLLDNQTYRARATFASDMDLLTAQRDASGRLAEDLAQQVVDDVLGMKW